MDSVSGPDADLAVIKKVPGSSFVDEQRSHEIGRSESLVSAWGELDLAHPFSDRRPCLAGSPDEMVSKTWPRRKSCATGVNLIQLAVGYRCTIVQQSAHRSAEPGSTLGDCHESCCSGAWKLTYSIGQSFVRVEIVQCVRRTMSEN